MDSRHGEWESQMRCAKEAEVALHDLAQSIDAIYEWGQNAKDPLGNFLPDALASDVKEKYNRLKWLIVGLYSTSGLPRNGSLGQTKKW